MNNYELNKLFAALLLACLILSFTSNTVDILYQPEEVAKRGYTIDTGSAGAAGAATSVVPAITKEEIINLIQKASIEKGAVQAKKCISCHTFEKGGKSRIGPNLWGIVGAKTAHDPNFGYSKALESKEGKWCYEELYHMINSPRKYIKGTAMSFVGISNKEAIADVIAYLKTLNDNPDSSHSNCD